MSKPVVYIRRDAFEELRRYVIGGGLLMPTIQTYNFIFKPEKDVVNVDNKELVIIKRHGVIVYEDKG